MFNISKHLPTPSQEIKLIATVIIINCTLHTIFPFFCFLLVIFNNYDRESRGSHYRKSGFIRYFPLDAREKVVQLVTGNLFSKIYCLLS